VCIFRNAAGENVEGQRFFISEVTRTVLKTEPQSCTGRICVNPGLMQLVAQEPNVCSCCSRSIQLGSCC